MAHPIIETKWQLDKIRALLNQMDTELDEADYQSARSQELVEQASKWEEAKEEAKSLVQQVLTMLGAMPTLQAQNIEDLEALDNKIDDAYKILEKVIEELEK